MNRILYLLPFAIFTFTLSCKQSTPPLLQSAKIKIQNNHVNIAYTDDGQADTTLLFVHGWCINKTYWTDQVAFFDKKYRVVTIDLPGYGLSGKNRKDWSTAAFAGDVNAVITQLHLKKVILIGHSMAGEIVLQAAINTPQQVIGLVGIDNFKGVGIASSPARAKQYKEEYEQAMGALKTNFKAAAFNWFNDELFYKTTGIEIRRRVLNDVAHADTTIAVASLAYNNFDEAAKLLQAKTKLYLINSDVYPTDTSGLKAKKIPFRLFYIHATGHFPMIEQPRQFNKLLGKVIEDIRSTK